MNKQNKPNVVYILADDMGFGDIKCFDEKCKIPTPNLDQMAKDGIRYTDAHASAAVCTPSRYGILTGRYCWRGMLEKQVLWAWDKAIVEPERTTIADMYKSNGYDTACVGKWHLGWNWKNKNGEFVGDKVEAGVYNKKLRTELAQTIDFEAEITGGPVDCGFDSYYGIDVPNFAPYTYFENNRLNPLPTEHGVHVEPAFGTVWEGPSAKDWSLDQVAVDLSKKAVEYIETRDKNPFFLFYALTGPHTPIAPTKDFIGKSGIDLYGDFVVMMDWAVGEVLKALERKGLAENTLVVFTCDNGPENFAYDRIKEHSHYSMAHLRGLKRDCWEGGHRVPMIAQWKNNIKGGQVSDETVSLLDFFATSADILGYDIKSDEGEDSLSFLPTFSGESPDRTKREGILYHSDSGKFSVRVGDWVYIDSPSGDDNKEPEWFKEERGVIVHTKEKELFNLKEDTSQRNNLYGTMPKLEARMANLLEKYKTQTYSVER